MFLVHFSRRVAREEKTFTAHFVILLLNAHWPYLVAAGIWADSLAPFSQSKCILIGSTELGYQLIYLLRPDMVNEHSTTNWAESFFLASNPARKMDLAANLN